MFFEPPNLASLGIPTSLGEVRGPKVAVYPHMYDPNIESATYTPGGVVEYDPAFFARWAAATSPYTERHPVPLLVGEWGIAQPDRPGMDAFVRDSLATLEQVGSGWSVFNWCRGTGYCPLDAAGADRPAIGQIFQPYARAIAGAPTASRWDPATRTLRVTFADNAATGPTDIYVHAPSYPDGWVVEASDAAGHVVAGVRPGDAGPVGHHARHRRARTRSACGPTGLGAGLRRHPGGPGRPTGPGGVRPAPAAPSRPGRAGHAGRGPPGPSPGDLSPG